MLYHIYGHFFLNIGTLADFLGKGCKLKKDIDMGVKIKLLNHI